MVKKLSWLVGMMLVVFSATAMAQTVPLADRPLVLEVNKGEVGLDISVGLDKSLMAKRFALKNEYFGDRYSGLSFGYGVIENLEVGLALNLGWKDKKYVGQDGFKFGGAYVYGKYGFHPMVGAELGIRIPGEKFGDNRVGVTVGVPFQYIAMPGVLKIHARPDLLVDFKKKATLGGGKAVQLAIVFDAGVTINATPELFFDVSGGMSKQLSPSADLIPGVAVTAGYTVIPAMDLFLNFAMNNLNPLAGGAMDAKGMTLGATYRFP